MRRLAALVLLLPLALVACGGGGKKSSTTTSTAADPGRTAIVALLHAASHHDAQALWALLSTQSQKRYGSLAAFRAGAATTIEKSLVPFEHETISPFISQSVSQQFGIVAVRAGSKALAFPLRHQNGGWKVETPGPVTISISGPQPGSHGLVAQIGVEIHAPTSPDDGVLWVDGSPVQSQIYSGPKSATVFANLTKALPAGIHIAVAYAEAGNNASAVAWTFTATS
ncbi:MAG TPA: hypothetical protein VLJ76_05850 [Gaiellaceae bacterium]|nr:hypothetical protein [Gaiellaceae bacterium]